MKFLLYFIIFIAALFLIRILPRILSVFISGPKNNNTPQQNRRVQDKPKYDKSKIVDADFEEIK
jgi:predicted esterase